MTSSSNILCGPFVPQPIIIIMLIARSPMHKSHFRSWTIRIQHVRKWYDTLWVTLVSMQNSMQNDWSNDRLAAWLRRIPERSQLSDKRFATRFFLLQNHYTLALQSNKMKGFRSCEPVFAIFHSSDWFCHTFIGRIAGTRTSYTSH